MNNAVVSYYTAMVDLYTRVKEAVIPDLNILTYVNLGIQGYIVAQYGVGGDISKSPHRQVLTGHSTCGDESQGRDFPFARLHVAENFKQRCEALVGVINPDEGTFDLMRRNKIPAYNYD